MHLLVINSGSSSIKFSIFSAEKSSPYRVYEGDVLGIGSGRATFRFRAIGADIPPVPVQAGDSVQAMGHVAAAVTQTGIPTIDAVGFRVVHPGPAINRHVRITDEVLHQLDEAAVFAPLHDPPAVAIIRDTMARFPDVPHFACFDTVFHLTMPETAYVYAILPKYREQGVRRYGFHGLSCESIVAGMREASMPIPRRMVIAHLGSGCSITAVADGLSIDTTMGLTPTGGVVMGTRPGDLDPGLMLYLLREKKGDRTAAVDAIEQLLNHESGIVALSGLPNDMRSTREAAAQGNQRAQLAIAIFTRSIRKAIGSYSWLMGGLDTIVFTGGIGEHDAKSRLEILDGLAQLGIRLDVKLNTAEKMTGQAQLWRISASESKTDIYVIPAKEDWMIAQHVQRMLNEN